ncbi:c-type cytochrome [Profundibacter sp.]
MRSLLLFLILATTASAAEVSSPRAAKLRHLVEQDCGACHGMTRKGGLGPDIRAQTLQGRDAEGLAQIIKDGIPDTAMPPWGPLLADQDINWIAEYLLEDTEE